MLGNNTESDIWSKVILTLGGIALGLATITTVVVVVGLFVG